MSAREPDRSQPTDLTRLDQARNYQQILAYAQDLNRLYHQETALRRELEERIAAMDALQRRLRQQVTDLLALHEIGLAINSARNLPEMFDHIAQSLVFIIQAHHCVLYLWSEADQAFYSQVGFGIFRERPEDVALRESALTRQILTSGQVIEVGDTETADRARFEPATRRGLRALLGVPMITRGVRVGVLYAGYREPHTFDDRERQLTRLVAELSSVALHRWQLLDPAGAWGARPAGASRPLPEERWPG